jgi:sugar phosphate isomerase/epimerase
MNHKIAISTISLGWHHTHTLDKKLHAASSAGFAGVEVFITDLNKYAADHGISQLEAATQIGNLCSQHNLGVVCLGSFDNFEGDPKRNLDERLSLAKEWIEMAHALNTVVIQIPSNDDKDAVGDENTVVAELQALADLGLQAEPPIRFAYEALGWGTHVADWDESLRVVDLVNRPNFGLCLDTYHVLGRLWADPRAPSGRRPGGAAAVRDSLNRFLQLCRDQDLARKIIYIQLSDAEHLDPPILPGHEVYDQAKDGVHSWCMYGRLFPLETDKGAYLPVEDICRTWLKDSGWNGWVSMEIFHREMKDETHGPEEWASRGIESWRKMLKMLS